MHVAVGDEDLGGAASAADETEVADLLRRLFKCVRYEVALKSFFFDELVNAVQRNGGLRSHIVAKIKECVSLVLSIVMVMVVVLSLCLGWSKRTSKRRS